MPGVSHDAALSQRRSTARNRLRAWGLPVSEIAQDMGVSRQYVWQVLHNRLPVSSRRFAEIERAVEERIQRERVHTSAGKRLRRARVEAGYTLKQAAAAIGYSWVAVERWERDVCLPKPGVLWHLRHVYGVDENWTLTRTPGDGTIDQSRIGAALRQAATPSQFAADSGGTLGSSGHSPQESLPPSQL